MVFSSEGHLGSKVPPCLPGSLHLPDLPTVLVTTCALPFLHGPEVSDPRGGGVDRG